MELYKICPTCQTGNKPTELLCSRCFGDISGVTPTGLPQHEPLSSGEPAPPPLHIILADGRRIEICSGDTVGRAAVGGELFSEFAAVSRRHSHFEYRDGSWLITDLNSTNGTWLAGKRLLKESPTPLINGQEIRMASRFRAVVRIGG